MLFWVKTYPKNVPHKDYILYIYYTNQIKTNYCAFSLKNILEGHKKKKLKQKKAQMKCKNPAHRTHF